MREGFPHTTKFLVSSYLTLVLCALGFVGNLLCAVVQFNKRTQVSTYIYIVRALTISDLFLLSLGFLRTLHNMGYLDMDVLYNIQVIFFWDWMVTSSTKYLTVAISAERSFAINYPFKAMAINVKRSKWYTIGVITFCAALTITSFVYVQWIDHEMKFYDVWAGSFLQLIPIIMVTIFNICIFYGLHSRNNVRMALAKDEADEKKSVNKMLIGIVLTFAFCHSFELARRVMNIGWKDYMSEYNYYDYSINILADIFYVLNSSLDFVIYYLFGRKFRTVFLEVFRNRFWFKNYGNNSSATSSEAAKSKNFSRERGLDEVGK